MDYSLWILHKYGLSQNIIRTVSKQIDNLFDLIILEKKNNILGESNRKKALKKSIDVLVKNPNFFSENLLQSPYILLKFGAPFTGLTKIVEKNNISSIHQLRTMKVEEINNSMDGNMIVTINKIKDSIEVFDSYGYYKKSVINTIVLNNLFKLRKITINKLVDTGKLLPEKYYETLNLSIDEVLGYINELIESNYIHLHNKTYYFPSNIYYESEYDKIEKRNSLITKDDNISCSLVEHLGRDFKDKDILLQRLEGRTLEEVGSILNISRERVRQRQAKVLKNLSEVEEINKYKSVFEEYGFTEDEFIKVFNESQIVYRFLSLTLKKGKKDSGNYILNSKTIPGSKKMVYLKKHKYYLTRFGELKRISKQEFVEEILFKYKNKRFIIEDFMHLYSKEAEKYKYLNLEVNNHNSILGITSRSNFVINSYGQKFRYFDLAPTSDDELFRNLINKLDDGFYSMQKIFNENKSLMNQLDIRDEYELHNFYKKRDDLLQINASLHRTPEFKIGEVNKFDFIKEVLIEYSDQPLKDCIDYLYEEYGFRKNTMSSYILSNFRHLIVNNNIKIYNNLKKSKLKDVSILLDKNIYLKNEVIKIFNNQGLQFNSHSLERLGYFMTGNIIFKKKLKNVSSAFSSIVLNSDIWRRGNTSVENSNEMSSFLSRMERKQILVVLDEGVYAKTSFLAKRGVGLNLINDYIESIYSFLPEKSYFTLYSLNELNFVHHLQEFGFENIFYERLISTSKLFNPVNRGSPGLFAKNISNPVTLSDFFEYELRKQDKGIDIYDFKDDLKDKFNIEFEINDIQYRLQKAGIYYSKNLEKLYIDKEIYLDEVYS